MSSPAATARSQFTFSDRRLGGSVRYTREPRLDPEAAAPLTLTSDPGPELDTAATEVTEVGSLASSVSRQYESQVSRRSTVGPGWRSNMRGDYGAGDTAPLSSRDLVCWAYQVHTSGLQTDLHVTSM